MKKEGIVLVLLGCLFMVACLALATPDPFGYVRFTDLATNGVYSTSDVVVVAPAWVELVQIYPAAGATNDSGQTVTASVAIVYIETNAVDGTSEETVIYTNDTVTSLTVVRPRVLINSTSGSAYGTNNLAAKIALWPNGWNRIRYKAKSTGNNAVATNKTVRIKLLTDVR